ncbi:hypothetical protein GW17_00054908, partial [Ensete ventricosum]
HGKDTSVGGCSLFSMLLRLEGCSGSCIGEELQSSECEATDSRAMGIATLWYHSGETSIESSIPCSQGGRVHGCEKGSRSSMSMRRRIAIANSTQGVQTLQVLRKSANVEEEEGSSDVSCGCAATSWLRVAWSQQGCGCNRRKTEQRCAQLLRRRTATIRSKRPLLVVFNSLLAAIRQLAVKYCCGCDVDRLQRKIAAGSFFAAKDRCWLCSRRMAACDHCW